MKTKTMYVCKADLDNYKNFIMSEVKEGRQDFEVEIRWKEPGKKAELTEEQFQKIYNKAHIEWMHGSGCFDVILKSMIFGANDE